MITIRVDDRVFSVSLQAGQGMLNAQRSGTGRPVKIAYARRPSVILPDCSENGDRLLAPAGDDGARETAS